MSWGLGRFLPLMDIYVAGHGLVAPAEGDAVYAIDSSHVAVATN